MNVLSAWGSVAGVLLALSCAAGPVCFEAESAQTVSPPLRIVVTTQAVTQVAVSIAQASGKSYAEIPQGVGKPPETGGAAIYRFVLPDDGEYVLWVRCWWDDACGNSLGMSLDDKPEFTFGQDTTYACWHWVKSPPRLLQLKLAAGPHTLRVSNREDGVRFDQILLTTDRKFIPVEIERAAALPAATP